MVDEGMSSSGGELTLESPRPARRTRRTALWGVLAAVAVAAGALAVTSGGGSDGGPDRLPIALGSNAGAGREAAMAADMSMAAWITYIAGDDLPGLGGDGPAYRVSGAVDEAAVRSLAEALGMSGDPIDQDGYWHLESDGAALDVYPGTGGTWSYWVNQGGDVAIGSDSGSGYSSSSGGGGCPDDATCIPTTTAPDAATDVPSSRECEPGTKCVEPSGPATTSPCPPDAMCTLPIEECPPNASCAIPEPIEPTPPADLPSEDEARQIALDLLGGTGMDVDDAKVTVDGPYDAWYVNVEPTIDGLPVSGWYASVSVGSKGEVLNASGVLGDVEALGDYPTIDTRAAVDRLNEQQSGLYGAVGMTAEDVPAVARTEDAVSSDSAVGGAPAVGTSDGATTTVVGTAGSAGACEVQPDGREICETLPAPAPAPAPAPCVDVDVVQPQAGEETAAIDQCVQSPICPDVLVDPAVGAPAAGGQTDPTSGSATSAIAPACAEPVPMPEPEPIEMVLTGAERILVVLPAVDESGDSYLVPGYRFTGEDGSTVDVAAVTDGAMAPTTTVDPAATGDTEPGSLPSDDCKVLLEDDASGTTHTINPCPQEIPPSSRELTHLSDGDTPQLGLPYYVDVETHCGTIVWAGRWWRTDSPTPLGWSTPTEGGAFTLSTPDEGTFVGDGAGTKTATFIAQGAAADIPGCA
jgi:hypothetical protein